MKFKTKVQAAILTGALAFTMSVATIATLSIDNFPLALAIGMIAGALVGIPAGQAMFYAPRFLHRNRHEWGPHPDFQYLKECAECGEWR